MTFPRALTQREQEVIEALLPDRAFPDVDVYRAQVEHTTVVGVSAVGADMDMEGAPDASRAAFRTSPLPPAFSTDLAADSAHSAG